MKMEDNHQLTIFEYQDYKERIRKELSNVANGFVVIGYYLKKVRDSKAYEQDGYKSIAEYAQKEYGISQSTTSRFIKINDKYSEGGYSLEMQEQYKGLGSSRLTEMLTLPVEDHELITSETKIADIRALKNMDKAADDTIASTDHTKLQGVLAEMLKGKKAAVEKVIAGEVDMYEYINPSGAGTYKKGIFFITMLEDKVLVKEFPNTTTYSIEEFLRIVKGIYDGYTSYEDYYGSKPVKEEIKETDKPTLKEPKNENDTKDTKKALATSQKSQGNPREKSTLEESEKATQTTENGKNDTEETTEAVEKDKNEDIKTGENVEKLRAESNTKDDEKPIEAAVVEPTEASVIETVEGTIEDRESITHELKILSEYYNQIQLYNKTFEIRKNDRDYRVGDKLLLKEWDGTSYTGREKQVDVIYILNNVEGLVPGDVIMAIDF